MARSEPSAASRLGNCPRCGAPLDALYIPGDPKDRVRVFCYRCEWSNIRKNPLRVMSGGKRNVQLEGAVKAL